MTKRINLRVHLPEWMNRLYPKAIWRMPTGEKTVYLTFDDGPIPTVTCAILDILKERNIKATFFCVGDNVVKYPEIFCQILEQGHAVGNHTHNHLHGMKTSNSDYISNIHKAAQHINSRLFRPPYGLMKGLQYKAIVDQYDIVMWDVISCDYDPDISPEKCFQNVVDFVRDGSIITFHDSIKSEKNVLTALPRVIDYLLSQGYSFRKITSQAPLPEKAEKSAKDFKQLQKSTEKIRKSA
jgi:peptidoglycan/xylan/chitin deacetylase (PgdA/CDA1 family)